MNFEFAFDYLIKNEGEKWVNDPLDSGGLTKFGITKRSYEDFMGMPLEDNVIKNMTRLEAMYFYRYEYWDALRLDEINELKTQVCLFDSSVLYGKPTSVKMSQKVCAMSGYSLKFDGILGDKTIAAINKIPSSDFIKAFHSIILNRINQIVEKNPKNKRFAQGWKNRADKLLKGIA